MATTYNVVYKNHCVPQEQISSGGKFYLDSDASRKFTGSSSTSVTLAGTGTHTSGTSITTSATSIASSKDFVFVKNTGATDVLISLTTDATAKYVIILSQDEAFSSEISTSANVRVKTASGTSTIDYFTVT
jgi:hypothetical protein